MLTNLSNSARVLWHTVWAYATAHKVIATIATLVVLYGGYYTYGVLTAPSLATRYVTTTVATGTVVATMTETGQISASRTLTLSPKASGEVIYIGVKAGDHVVPGQIIANLDTTNAAQALRDAKLSLEAATLTYEKNTAASTPLTLLQANNAVTNDQTALEASHNSAYSSIANIYTDLSGIINGLNSVLHYVNVAGRPNQQNIDISVYSDPVSVSDSSISILKNSVANSYDVAVTAYNSALATYNTTSRTAPNDQLVVLAQTTYKAAQAVADVVKNTHDFFDRVNTDYSLYNLGTAPTTLASPISSVNGYTTTVNNDLSTALSAKTSIISAEQALAEAEDALTTTQTGPDDLAMRSAAIALQNAQEAVTSAQNTLENYIVRAPFAGTIASVGVQTYDQASSGTSVATLVTNEETASITVNEVDASKFKVGQKATLTFDALPGVSIAGTVSVINTIGTVSQGVVSYGAIVTFDTQNASVLPGMSATANIVIGIETGLLVPSSAVKVANGQSYVLTFNAPLAGSDSSTGVISPVAPTRTNVTTGLTDNSNVIIKSGLSANAQVVTKTITGTSATTASSAAQSTSIFGIGGGGIRTGGTGGGAVRATGAGAVRAPGQ